MHLCTYGCMFAVNRIILIGVLGDQESGGKYSTWLGFRSFHPTEHVWLGVRARWLRVSLDCAFGIWRFFFFYTFVRLRLLFMYCSINSSCKVWLFYFFQPISAHRALFMDPQISLFNNFFIKNGFHGTIYTFKNYFATIFFSFQFSALSKLP